MNVVEKAKQRRAAWVQGLRDNPDQQGQERLVNCEGKMCCLGKLCEVMGLEQRLGGFFDGSITETHLPGEVVQHAVGLQDNTGTFNPSSLPKSLATNHHSLVGMNDAGIPWSFIANVIEAEPEGLFYNEQQMHRREWVRQLRANPEQQGCGYLWRGDKCCCLGKLLEVLDVPVTPLGQLEAYSGCIVPKGFHCEMVGLATGMGTFDASTLPSRIREKIHHLRGDVSLLLLNDDGVSWPTIADIIEAEPKGLFV